jgi:SAM-dependent methyltransferase
MDQKILYERLAAGWGGSRDESAALLGRDRFLTDDIRRQLGPSQTVSIAVLSIGDGRTTAAILAGLPCARLTCAELSESRIQRVREAIQANPELVSVMPDFVVCNFDTQFGRLPADTFDVVIALDIMEHVFDIFGFLDHCHRIAKQGALFYLRVPNIAYVRHRLRLLVGRIPVTSSWFGTPNGLARAPQLGRRTAAFLYDPHPAQALGGSRVRSREVSRPRHEAGVTSKGEAEPVLCQPTDGSSQEVRPDRWT